MMARGRTMQFPPTMDPFPSPLPRWIRFPVPCNGDRRSAEGPSVPRARPREGCSNAAPCATPLDLHQDGSLRVISVDASAVNGQGSLPRPGIAERLWDASRVEFSVRGYHGARVQGIARRANCNVALLYRHWASKKALYLDVLRSVWQGISQEVVALMEQGRGAPAVVGAYLDAHLRDPVGAQILIREFLDGGPFFSQLVAAEPTLVEPVQRAARTIASTGDSEMLRPGLDATMAVLSIGGLAA